MRKVLTALAAVLLCTATPAAADIVLDDNIDDLVDASCYTVDQPVYEGQTYGYQCGNLKLFFSGWEPGYVVDILGNVRLRVSPCDVDTCGGSTHAQLVVTTYSHPVDSYLRVDVMTKLVTQLRDSNPNPWESPWLFWGIKFKADGSLDKFNYLALKTNGWEVGTGYNGTGQTFIASGSTPTVSTTQYKNISVQQYDYDGQHEVCAQIGSTELDLDPNSESMCVVNEAFYDASGPIGLYTEDAVAYFDDLVIREPNN